jgi:hypothetical protein
MTFRTDKEKSRRTNLIHELKQDYLNIKKDCEKAIDENYKFVIIKI